MSFNVKNINWLYLVIASIAVLLICSVFMAADSSFLNEKKEPAVVINKTHYAAKRIPQVTVVNGVAITTYIYRPEQWGVMVSPEYSGSFIKCDIDSRSYHLLEVGNEIVIRIAVGRLTGNSYCKGISIDE
jgi:hypothetical protein